MADENYDKAFEKLNALINELLTEIAVSEEKMKNRLTKEDFQSGIRELEKVFYKKIVNNKEELKNDINKCGETASTALNDYKSKNSENITEIKVKIGKTTVITSLVLSILTSLIIAVVSKFV